MSNTIKQTRRPKVGTSGCSAHRCPKCGGRWKLWSAEGVRGVVCENGCVSRNYVPRSLTRSKERYQNYLRADSGETLAEWLSRQNPAAHQPSPSEV
jgi:hypothetical protein